MIGVIVRGVIWGCSREHVRGSYRGYIKGCVRWIDRGYSKGVLWGCSRGCASDRECDMGV